MKCLLCPNGCLIDKSVESGFCGTNGQIKIAKYYLHKFEGLTMDSLRVFWMQTSSLSFPGFVIQFFISQTRIGLSIFGIGVSVFILLDYFSRHTFVFRIWYLFWFTTIILLLQLIGIFGSIPYFIYVICRLIKRKY